MSVSFKCEICNAKTEPYDSVTILAQMFDDEHKIVPKTVLCCKRCYNVLAALKKSMADTFKDDSDEKS